MKTRYSKIDRPGVGRGGTNGNHGRNKAISEPVSCLVPVCSGVLSCGLLQIGGIVRLGDGDVETIRELSISRVPVNKSSWPGIRVGKSYKELIIHWGQEKPRPFSYLLQIPGKTYIKEMQAEIKCQVQEQWRLPSDADKGWACLDWDKLSRPLEVRSRRPGDRFYPLGLEAVRNCKTTLSMLVSRHQNVIGRFAGLWEQICG